MSYLMEETHLVEVSYLVEILCIMKMPCVDKVHISMREFSKLHVKYGMVPRV